MTHFNGSGNEFTLDQDGTMMNIGDESLNDTKYTTSFLFLFFFNNVVLSVILVGLGLHGVGLHFGFQQTQVRGHDNSVLDGLARSIRYRNNTLSSINHVSCNSHNFGLRRLGFFTTRLVVLPNGSQESLQVRLDGSFSLCIILQDLLGLFDFLCLLTFISFGFRTGILSIQSQGFLLSFNFSFLFLFRFVDQFVGDFIPLVVVDASGFTGTS
mmetsp:Transcript_17735/g.43750  ORF Transcript_17735/g.43750 Transcript_17735/m.43750 type:complete len:212 (-) Transcript_17735:79-714(-)